SGLLSVAQTVTIADAAIADPRAESRLVTQAGGSSLADLRTECARTKAAAQHDGEERRRRIHARRSLRAYTDDEGVWNLHMRDNPEVGAQIMAELNVRRDRLFRLARAEGRREPPEAYLADALAEAVRDNGGGAKLRSARAKIIVRVDLGALLGGYPVGEETCEIAGYGPVAVSAVRDLIDSGDPFLAAVVTKGTEVVGVAHLGRHPSAHQTTALEWLYPTCTVEGCATVAGLEYDHRRDWAATHVTVLDFIDRLCRHHHSLKTVDNWALAAGRGKRAFVPPEDPRHPCRC
ncbi:MAG: hypothetical protein ACRD0M_12605, partial [Acidimicrobiales bacterium]